MDHVQLSDWIDNDPDAETVARLSSLVERADSGDADAIDEIEASFSTRLSFGTAGLRGPMGPGPNRMNIVVVRRTAAAIARYLAGVNGRSVVIAFDGRNKSREFATAAAETFAGFGFSTHLFAEPVPTPVLAYTIRRFGHDAGIMITASHNPAGDNGLKVYLADGSQIISPADSDISAEIDALSALPVTSLPSSHDWIRVGDDAISSYVSTVARLVTRPSKSALRIVYTPLHGVGRDVFLAAVKSGGFSPPIVVPAQADPNPSFPTVEFPNPEEPGALDLAIDLASRSHADLIIAHDPDADRCAVAIPSKQANSRGWRRLSGDELGALLAWWLVVRKPQVKGEDASTHNGSCVIAQSVVSGTMVESIARQANCIFVRTLTGFKWISRVPNLTFGYEEALGYCVDPSNVRDKDGISAAIVVMEMAGVLAENNETLEDALALLENSHGVHLSDQVALRIHSPQESNRLTRAILQGQPRSLAGLKVVHIDDLETGLEGLPPTSGLVIQLEGNCRLIVRPSGTEPKIKFYLQTASDPGLGREAGRTIAEARMSNLRQAVSELVELADG